MNKLLKFLKGYRAVSIIAPLFKLMEALFELIIPLVVAKIIDVGIVNEDFAYILKMGGLMLILGAAGLGFSLLCQFLAARAALGFGTNVRSALYSHIMKLSAADVERFSPGSLTTRLNNDTTQVQMGVAMFIRLVLRAPFIAVGAIVMAILIDPKISIIFFVMAALVVICITLVMRFSTPRYKIVQKKLDTVSSLSKEALSGGRVIRAFNKTEQMEKNFFEKSSSLASSSTRVAIISALLNPLTFALINLSIIAVLYFGGKTVSAGNLSRGDVVALVNYLSQTLLALVVFANLIITFTKSSASASRINEILACPPDDITENESVSQPNEKRIEQLTTPRSSESSSTFCESPLIEFKNVSFGYPGDSGETLKNISFSINCGETLGIIGSTGSGKSTLVGLILGLYKITDGEYNFKGINAYSHGKNFRKDFGYVEQKAMLFSGSIRSNLLLSAPDATDEDMEKALKLSQSYDFVSKIPKGIDSVVTAKGKNFSGGQRQRLTIARALVKKPKILLLDDGASALDFATEARLKKAIASLNITTIMVSSRISSIIKSDKILVLENGAIAGLAKHGELMKTCAIYKEIYDSQTK